MLLLLKNEREVPFMAVFIAILAVLLNPIAVFITGLIYQKTENDSKRSIKIIISIIMFTILEFILIILLWNMLI